MADPIIEIPLSQVVAINTVIINYGKLITQLGDYNSRLGRENAKRRVERNYLREELDGAQAEAANLGEAFSEIYERWVGTQRELEEALDSLQDMEDERDHALLTIDRMIAGIDEAIEHA